MAHSHFGQPYWIAFAASSHDVAPRRVAELDALRGLAAVTVVLHHLALCDPLIGAGTRHDGGLLVLNLLKYTPLSIVFAGSQAVILFFVLSGYVLALPFLGGSPPRYRAFLLRRAMRIWPPYAFAVLVAFGLCVLIGHGAKIGELSGWLNSQWNVPPSAGALGRHFAFLQGLRGDRYDPVLWTMIHEARISLVFPLLLWLTLSRRPRVAVAVAIGLCFVGFRSAGALAEHGVHVDWLETLAFASCFVVGILLASHRAGLEGWFRRRAKVSRAGLLLVAILLYTYPDTVPPTVAPLLRERWVETLLTTCGAALVIVVAQWSCTASRALRREPAQFVGRISYSLYITHAIVLLAVVHLLWGRLPIPVLVTIFLLGSAIASTVVHRFVERPSMRLGRNLSERLWAQHLATPSQGRGRASPSFVP